ncbi:MAG: RpiB/LacA/LacB family sugar-phosphate isomerase [Candidatus Liptonbacteria bacterium]|nr:RpiB/LacA/LacB family sugar-phosphate isomerase [Candidatus Liptonbacteria bacterium]
MVIYLGADHRGFSLKEAIKDFLQDKGYEVFDLGNSFYDEKDDYPDFAVKVAQKVSLNSETSRGILICGSGVGVDVTANKFKNVRSALGITSDQIYDARHDDNVNILSLAADYMNLEDAEKIVQVFLSTPFSGEERFSRRIEKITQIENK